ncbi:unnamed protein product [Rotaria sordida]|uniref:Uncharacterized protein n=1 Tax=Rotaria sordida TaxID=392033 RepID=A0A815GAD9_9BILA|nr:unnamed protein product [Rotaria sordida]
MTDSGEDVERDIDRFNDVFHEYGDDIDEDEDKNIDFDNLQRTIIEEEDEYNEDDDNESVIPIEELLDHGSNVILLDPTVEEDELSQKLSQLSASSEVKRATHQEQTKESKTRKRPALTPTTPTTTITTTLHVVQTTKKFKTSDDKEQSNYTLPRYLSSANKTFEERMASILQNVPYSSITIEHLRHIAYLINKIECVELDKSLWTEYLLSGTGKLRNEELPRIPRAITTATTSSEFDSTSKVLLWPNEVKTKMKADGIKTTTDSNADDYNACLKYVKEVLEKYEKEIVDYQAQLKQIKERFMNIFTNEMEEAIMKFVQRYGVSLYKLIIEEQIAVVKYDYKNRLIQLEFYHEEPNCYQQQVFENLTVARREKETAKFEVAILKQRAIHNHLPKSFQSLDIPTSISLNNINDPRIRQQLYEKCEKILQKTKSEMMLVYIAVAETKMNETKEKFNKDMADMQDIQHSGPHTKRLTQNMVAIMNRRFQNINERLVNLYKLKLHYFDVAPMAKN